MNNKGNTFLIVAIILGAIIIVGGAYLIFNQSAPMSYDNDNMMEDTDRINSDEGMMGEDNDFNYFMMGDIVTFNEMTVNTNDIQPKENGFTADVNFNGNTINNLNFYYGSDIQFWLQPAGSEDIRLKSDMKTFQNIIMQQDDMPGPPAKFNVKGVVRSTGDNNIEVTEILMITI